MKNAEDVILYSIFGIIATVVAYGYAVNLIPRKGKCFSYDSNWSYNDSLHYEQINKKEKECTYAQGAESLK
jgi:hypothetical protein